MYPFIRFTKEMLLNSRSQKLPVGDVHVSHHICWPWDIDLWMEMNNGLTLTIYDLGRIPMVYRSGLIGVMRKKGWSMAVAGASIRYRRRVRMFNRVTLKSAILGWDSRFLYLQQSMWRKGEATSSILVRLALTSPDGIVPPGQAMTEIGRHEASPPLPEYVHQWIAAEAQRPWPPAF